MGNLGEEDMRPLYTTFETSNKLFQTKIFLKVHNITIKV